jgi:hypothetical protein
MRSWLLVVAYLPLGVCVLGVCVLGILGLAGVSVAKVLDIFTILCLLGSIAILVFIGLAAGQRSASPWERGGWILSFILLPYLMMPRYYRRCLRNGRPPGKRSMPET